MRYTSTTKRWIDANVIQQVPGVRVVTVETSVIDGGAAAGGQVGAVDGGAP